MNGKGKVFSFLGVSFWRRIPLFIFLIIFIDFLQNNFSYPRTSPLHFKKGVGRRGISPQLLDFITKNYFAKDFKLFFPSLKIGAESKASYFNPARRAFL